MLTAAASRSVENVSYPFDEAALDDAADDRKLRMSMMMLLATDDASDS